jgi:hypothetical protein
MSTGDGGSRTLCCAPQGTVSEAPGRASCCRRGRAGRPGLAVRAAVLPPGCTHSSAAIESRSTRAGMPVDRHRAGRRATRSHTRPRRLHGSTAGKYMPVGSLSPARHCGTDHVLVCRGLVQARGWVSPSAAGAPPRKTGKTRDCRRLLPSYLGFLFASCVSDEPRQPVQLVLASVERGFTRGNRGTPPTCLRRRSPGRSSSPRRSGRRAGTHRVGLILGTARALRRGADRVAGVSGRQ